MFKRLLLLGMVMCCMLRADEAALPGGLAGLHPGDIYVAYRICREDIPDMAVYLAACTRNYTENENQLPPAPPEASDDLAILEGTSRYSTIGRRIANLQAFRLEWELTVDYQDRSPRKLLIDRVAGTLPQGAAVAVYDADEQLICTVDDGGSSFSAAPGSYTFVVEMAMKEGVVCTYQLLPGWNLINIPLAQVTDGAQLMEMDVRNWRRQPVDSAEKLLAGNGYWVRNAGDQPRTVTITGKAYIRREASME
ncbi:MAG: hypothetical protein J6S21_06435, partial [Victivallales bacterium]|nr:hypothetical protein [Victivallales bacterium]